MASNSGRKSGSSGRSSSRSRVVIGADETARVRQTKDRPPVQPERKRPKRAPSSGAAKERAHTRAPRPSAGRKVASKKRDDRDRRRRQISRRRALFALLVIAFIGGIAWGAVALWQAPLFTVHTVRVRGNVHLARDVVLKLAAVPPDATLLRLPKQQILSRVQASPWVAHAEVTRGFPSTLNIVVTERTALVLVDAGPAGEWLASSDGYWIVRHSNEPTAGLVPVRDVPNLRPVEGLKINSTELKNALAVVAGISTQLRSQTKFVSAASVERTMIVLNNDVQVFVGPADDMAKKDLIARGILGSKKGVVYVNVRVTDRPTWRGLTPAN
jgi:cell division protein FtsQ